MIGTSSNGIPISSEIFRAYAVRRRFAAAPDLIPRCHGGSASVHRDREAKQYIFPNSPKKQSIKIDTANNHLK